MADQAGSQAPVARTVALAALLIALGNIASRILGLARESAIAFFFARGTAADAFTLAWTVPSTIYDLLIAGAISAALVPVLSEFAEGDQAEFWRLVRSIFSIILLALALLLLLVAWQTPLLVNLLVQPDQTELRALTIYLIRLLLPALFFMGCAGLIMAVLYARQKFLLPAFNGAVFNLGIVAGLLLFHQQLGVASLAAGALIGGLAQVLVQLPGLRGMAFRTRPDLTHPAVRRILWLYAPVALGISFSIIGTTIDRWLASGLPAAPATMRFATTLIQFPLGLIAAAVSMAVLPTLSRQHVLADEDAFRSTLAMGLKVVLLLVIPATFGIAALALPLTTLVYERGAFDAADAAATATALLFYLPGLPAAAVDQVLLFAFYARKNTLTPNLVQGAAILVYLLTALPLLFLSNLGFLALVLGNSAQWIGHAIILTWLMRRQVRLSGLRIGETLLKSLLASLIMATLVLAIQAMLATSPALLQLIVAGGTGLICYLLITAALRVEALDFFLAALRRKFNW